MKKLLTIMLCLMSVPLLSGVGLAQEEPAPLKIALVNVTRLQSEFQARQQALEELRQWMTIKDNVYRELRNYLLLPEEHFIEVTEILEMPPPLPDERQKRLEELKALSDSKLAEYVTLQAKPDRTTTEDDRFKTLAEQYSRCQDLLNQYADSAQVEFEQKGQEMDNRLNAKILEAVKNVSEENGYSLVLGYSVVLNLAAVLYAVAPVADITDDVIAVLNPPLEAPAEGGGEEAPPEEPEGGEEETPPEEPTEGDGGGG